MSSSPGSSQTARPSDNTRPYVNSVPSNPDTGYIPMPPPEEGDCYVLADPQGENHWGNPDFVNFLQQLSRKWCNEHPNGPWLYIDDMSLPDGSHFEGHDTHRDGLTVDLQTYPDSENICDIDYPNQDLTIDFLNLAGEMGAVRVFYNHPAVIEALPMLVQYWGGHDKHCHLEASLSRIPGAIPDNEVTILDPKYAEVYKNRGVAKANLGDYKGAIDDYNKSIKLDPNDAEVYGSRGIAKTKLEDYRGAMRDYDKAIGLDPDYPHERSRHLSFYHHRGLAKAELGDFESAVEDYDKAIEYSWQKWGHEIPKPLMEYTLLCYHRGFARAKLGRYGEAIEDYNHAIDIGLKDANLFYNRGLAWTSLEGYKRALPDFDKAVELDLNHVEAYHYRGVAKAKLGNHQAALLDFDKAIELNPKLADAYNARGLSKNALGDPKGAIDDYNKAIALNSKDAEDFNKSGLAKLDSKNGESAIEDFERAIQLNPNYAPAYNNRGVAMLDFEVDQLTIMKDFNRAIQLNPKSAVFYSNRGVFKYRLEDHKGAMKDLDKAIQLNPKHSQSYFRRGQVKYALKDYEGAVKDFDKAIKLNPKLAEAHRARREAKQKLERRQTGEIYTWTDENGIIRFSNVPQGEGRTAIESGQSPSESATPSSERPHYGGGARGAISFPPYTDALEIRPDVKQGKEKDGGVPTR